MCCTGVSAFTATFNFTRIMLPPMPGFLHIHFICEMYSLCIEKRKGGRYLVSLILVILNCLLRGALISDVGDLTVLYRMFAIIHTFTDCTMQQLKVKSL